VETLEHGTSGGPAAAAHGPLLVHLLCADDLTIAPWRRYLTAGERVSIGRGDAPGAGVRRIALADPYASGSHTELDGAGGAWRLSDAGSTNGTWLDGRRLGPGETVVLGDAAMIEVGHTIFWFRATALHVEPGDGQTLCPEWQAQLQAVDRLARSVHPVLVEGESGVGKELLARLLHERSGRRGALVSVNCAALPEHLLEDELFGHVRGAFSGALASREGLIRAAHDGTLFLDEVGDMPAELQARLLRVLEDHKVRPVGGEAEISVDVRIVAATHRDLRARVAEGAFRHDLLARLGLLPVRIPPLRDRREDLGLLIRALLGPPPNGLDKVQLEVEALRAIVGHDWPLNVRELRSALLSAADLARDSTGRARIAVSHLPITLRAAPPAVVAPAVLDPEDQALRDQIVQLLASHRGNVTAVARALGKKRTNLQRLMTRLGIERAG